MKSGYAEGIAAILFIAFLLISASAQGNATRDDALNAIQEAELDIQEMVDAGFQVNSVNDTLIAARQALERADFAELIRKNATGELAEKAREALEGLNYEGFTYDEVIIYTDDIASKKEQAFMLFDSLRALEIKMGDYREQGVNTSEAQDIYNKALAAFDKERHGETESLLSDANSNLDEKRAELTSLNVIIQSGRGFIEKNWRELLIAVIVLAVAGYIGWKKYRKKRIRNKLKKLKIEQETLIKLMKKAQTDMFKEAKLSRAIFNIKMEKYSKRLNEVKETIPVLEAMLKKAKTKGRKKIEKREKR